MPKLPQISGAQAIKVLEKVGFVRTRQSGSHVVLKKEAFPILLSVPLHKKLDRGLLRSLIRDAELTVDEFVGHL